MYDEDEWRFEAEELVLCDCHQDWFWVTLDEPTEEREVWWPE
jgi:hypothetical protein